VAIIKLLLQRKKKKIKKNIYIYIVVLILIELLNFFIIINMRITLFVNILLKKIIFDIFKNRIL